MNWNLNCRKVRRLLALWVGNDLDEAGQVEAERHMASCPHCREEWGRLKVGRQAVESLRVGELASAPLSASLWPAVDRQIRVLNHEAETATWRGWLPVGALAAACVSIVMVLPAGQSSPTAYTPTDSGSIPVFFSPQSVGEPGVPSWNTEGPGGRIPPALLQGPRVRTLLDGTDVRGL